MCYDLNRAPTPPSVPPEYDFADHKSQYPILPSDQPGAAASSSGGGESAPVKTEEKRVTCSQVKLQGSVQSEPDEDKDSKDALHLPMVEVAGPEDPLMVYHPWT